MCGIPAAIWMLETPEKEAHLKAWNLGSHSETASHYNLSDRARYLGVEWSAENGLCVFAFDGANRSRVPEVEALLMKRHRDRDGFMKACLRAGGDVNALDWLKHVALYWADRWGNAEDAAILRKHGAEEIEPVAERP